VQDCKGVIARKVREWQDDPKLAKYLRPETLFDATKFESYLGEKWSKTEPETEPDFEQKLRDTESDSEPDS